MRTAYKRDNGRDILTELERERSTRLRLEGQLAEINEVVLKMRAEIETLNKEIDKRDEEIVRLKSQINKDSSNSTKPPSNLEELVASGKAEHNVICEVGKGEAFVSDWLIDIKIITVYTEIRRTIGAPPKIGYGDTAKKLSVYLSVVGLIAVSAHAKW